MNIYTWTDGTELYHHGIIGQKWGVRRYQNPDGTLTSAGLKRYSKTVNENNSLEIKRDKHLEKAEKYEHKAPKYYFTDIGMVKQRKMSVKAIKEKQKAADAQKKIDKNNSKEYMKIGKNYLELLKNESLNSIKDYDDFVIQSAKKFIENQLQDSKFNDSYTYNKFVSELLEGTYGEESSIKLQSLNEKMNSNINKEFEVRRKIYRR